MEETEYYAIYSTDDNKVLGYYPGSIIVDENDIENILKEYHDDDTFTMVGKGFLRLSVEEWKQAIRVISPIVDNGTIISSISTEPTQEDLVAYETNAKRRTIKTEAYELMHQWLLSGDPQDEIIWREKILEINGRFPLAE